MTSIHISVCTEHNRYIGKGPCGHGKNTKRYRQTEIKSDEKVTIEKITTGCATYWAAWPTKLCWARWYRFGFRFRFGWIGCRTVYASTSATATPRSKYNCSRLWRCVFWGPSCQFHTRYCRCKCRLGGAKPRDEGQRTHQQQSRTISNECSKLSIFIMLTLLNFVNSVVFFRMLTVPKVIGINWSNKWEERIAVQSNFADAERKTPVRNWNIELRWLHSRLDFK